MRARLGLAACLATLFALASASAAAASTTIGQTAPATPPARAAFKSTSYSRLSPREQVMSCLLEGRQSPPGAPGPPRALGSSWR